MRAQSLAEEVVRVGHGRRVTPHTPRDAVEIKFYGAFVPTPRDAISTHAAASPAELLPAWLSCACQKRARVRRRLEAVRARLVVHGAAPLVYSVASSPAMQPSARRAASPARA